MSLRRRLRRADAVAARGGGSAAGGLGETFTPDLSTGTGTFAVPLDLPNGPNDIGPKLVLRYDTASPNGPFGLGWALPLPRLLRSTMRGRPRYDDDDTLVLEGSGPLLRTAGRRLAARGRHRRLARDARTASAVDGFVVTDRAGMRYELGTTSDSRIDGPAGIPWSWLVHRIEDNLGHTATFAWRAAGAQRYLDTIDYGVYQRRVRIRAAAGPSPVDARRVRVRDRGTLRGHRTSDARRRAAARAAMGTGLRAIRRRAEHRC